MSAECWDVFLSYNRADRLLALRTTRALESRGLSVWFDLDQHDVHDWTAAIERGLNRSRSFLLVTTQPGPSAWVRSEIIWAMHRRRAAGGHFPIIRLSPRQAVEQHEWRELGDLPTISVPTDSPAAWDWAVARATECLGEPIGARLERTSLSASRSRMEARYRAWRRTPPDVVRSFFHANADAWRAHHEAQAAHEASWPVSPLERFIESVRTDSGLVIGDFGCGRAEMSSRLRSDHDVQSFDYISISDHVHAGDMAKTPLRNGTLDHAVYSLSLLTRDIVPHVAEASRTLKRGGLMHIMEPSWFFGGLAELVDTLRSFRLRPRSIEYFWKFGHLTAVRY